MIDKHISPKIDRYIGERVSIKVSYGMYFGVLDYADGRYLMNKPEYRSNKGEYHRWAKWSFRKSHVNISNIRIIGDAVVSKI